MNEVMRNHISAFTEVSNVPFVPEIKLHLGTEKISKGWLQRTAVEPPFWAFAWPGGLATARYICDHPELVRGLRVLDFASGSGVAAIASALKGAKQSIAMDVDPLALVAAQLNAEINNVQVEVIQSLDMYKPYLRADIILAGDVCYDQAMSYRTLSWLYLNIAKGVKVWLADPGRAYVPENGKKEIARYTIPVLRELEDRDTREVTLWELSLPE